MRCCRSAACLILSLWTGQALAQELTQEEKDAGFVSMFIAVPLGPQAQPACTPSAHTPSP